MSGSPQQQDVCAGRFGPQQQAYQPSAPQQQAPHPAYRQQSPAPQPPGPPARQPASLKEKSALTGLEPGERLLAFEVVTPARGANGAPAREVPRAWVAHVERRARLQLMARFRLHFADGSWAAFFVMRRRTIRAFAAQLGGNG